jgi:DNA polymerase IIIc chi subunit
MVKKIASETNNPESPVSIAKIDDSSEEPTVTFLITLDSKEEKEVSFRV